MSLPTLCLLKKNLQKINNKKMKPKMYMTILWLSLSNLGIGQSFNPEKLIGKWASVGKEVQVWTFKDASRLHILHFYNSMHTPGKSDTLNDGYRLENITSKGFDLILIINSDQNNIHETAGKCTWLNNNEFKVEHSSSELEEGNGTFVFTRQ
jgi:hypothetical protein